MNFCELNCFLTFSVQSSRGASATISPTNGIGSAQEVEFDKLAPSQKGGRSALPVLSRSSSDMPPYAGSHQNAKSIGICIRPTPGVAISQAQACLPFLPAEDNQGYQQVPASTHYELDVPSLQCPSLLDSGIGNPFRPILTAAEQKSGSSTPSGPSPTTTNHISRNRSDAAYYYDNGTPDLLLGFDRHVAFMKKDKVEDMTDSFKARPIPEDSHFFAGAGCIGESPYITSRSFDELHRHLGIGLSSDKVSHLDLNHLGSTANFIFPTPNTVSKQGIHLPAVDASSHLPDFAQS